MTESYYTFYMVVEYGSISKAAKAMFVTQPAVSKAIKNLESSLQVKLFHRTSKGVLPTSEGQVLYDHVKLGYKQIQEGEKLIKQLRERTYGAIRIGISNTLCKYYFIPHLKDFHQVYPNLKIEIVNRTSPETMKLLQEGFLDCAIISDVTMENNFAYHKLKSIQDIFVSKRKAPMQVMHLNQLESEPMLLLEKKNATREHLENFLIENQLKLNVDIEISSMEFLVEFAKIGLGVASVIGDFVKQDIENHTLYEWKTVPKIPARSIGLLYDLDSSRSIACQTFIDFMVERKEI